jgi:hypothetical protein
LDPDEIPNADSRSHGRLVVSEQEGSFGDE